MIDGYKVGNYAKSLAGHDKGCTYIIVETNNDDVYVADGKLKKVNNPKRKNIKHIQITKTIDINIEEKISKGEALTDLDIKMAIKKYIDEN